MSISIHTRQNLLDDQADILVNTVNCVGVMGKGLALAFKQRFPDMFEDYRRACRKGTLRPGQMHVWANPHHPANGLMSRSETNTWEQTHQGTPRLIVNFPTKDHWRNPSQLPWIQEGLVDLVHVAQTHDIASIAVPPLGCGLGGLSWKTVRPMIEQTFTGLPLDVRIYTPQ